MAMPEIPPTPEEIFPIGPYRSRRQAEAHGLVILAMGLSYQLERFHGRWFVLIDETQKEAVYDQLRRYEKENQLRKREAPGKTFSVHPPDAVLLAVLLMAMFFLQRLFPELSGYGAVDAAAIRAGEVWRTITALTLHGDLVHLVSNLVSLTLLLLLCQTVFGRGGALLGLIAAGTLGNLINALMHADGFRSIGMSTGIFALAGMLCGRSAARTLRGANSDWRRAFLALFVGAAYFSLFGIGGPGTDVTAHLFGLFAGFLAGGLAAAIPEARSPDARQAKLSLGAWLLIFGGWSFALLA